jgi:malate dehydrogenase (oxaloacetate-decarboxylating)
VPTPRPEVRIVMSGAGAAGSAIARLLLTAGAHDLVLTDIGGVVHREREALDPNREELAGLTNPRGLQGSLQEALVGADVFIGVSAPGILTGDDVATMAPGAVVFALANPTPEVDPAEARRTAAVVATGRSDEPNQINNVLAFPGVFRGLLDAGARHVDLEMEAAAARALADVVQPDQLNAAFIVPSVFDPAVTQAVAAAVRASVEARTS